MAGNDVFSLFHEIAAIGRETLQAYCDDGLQRPIAREYVVSLISVSANLLLNINLDPAHVERVGDRLFVPIDQLLVHIVERHFADPAERRRLCTLIRDRNKQLQDQDYTASINRSGRLFLTCKCCGAELATNHEGVEGWNINLALTEVTCGFCGGTFLCDGSDLHLAS